MDFELELLSSSHDRAAFSCGVPSLDQYLKTQVSQDTRRDVARCYVLRERADMIVIGYYTLSASSIDL